MNQEEAEELWSKLSIESFGAFAKYGTLITGALCLLAYSNEIGQFPEGIGLGEGLAFYLVCAGFLIVYTAYVVMCTATGCLLLAWPARKAHDLLVRRSALSKKAVGRALLHTDFSRLRDPLLLSLGTLGLFGHAVYILLSADRALATVFLMVPVAQAAVVFFWLVFTRQHQHLQAGVLLENESLKSLDASRRNTSAIRRVFLVFLVLAPLALAPERLFLVDAAFRLAQLRKDSATVHVKAPWSARVVQAGLKSGPSFLGSDYVEFKGIKVLLRSVGQKVVIEIPSASGTVRLPLPVDAIYIE